MSEKNVVQKAFETIIYERVYQVARNKAAEDPECLKIENKRAVLLDMLMDSLENEKQKELLRDLECAWNVSDSIFSEYVYRQGLEDSVMIRKEINLFGISTAENQSK